jgi:hypothetical protein
VKFLSRTLSFCFFWTLEGCSDKELGVGGLLAPLEGFSLSWGSFSLGHEASRVASLGIEAPRLVWIVSRLVGEDLASLEATSLGLASSRSHLARSRFAGKVLASFWGGLA